MSLEEGMRYSIDGDIIDERSQMLHRANNKLKQYQSREDYEYKLRNEHPPLQDAWDKYQAVLRLVE